MPPFGTSKPKRFILEPIEEPVDFDSNAIIIWRTTYLGYEFAGALNELFNFDFCRQESDTPLRSESAGGVVVCPTYTYIENLRNTRYMLFENPLSQGGLHRLLNGYDKILLISGADAYRTQSELYLTMTDRTRYADPANTRLCSWQRVVDDICQWIFETHCIDMRPCEPPSATLFYGSSLCDKMQLTVQKFFTNMLVDLDRGGILSPEEKDPRTEYLLRWRQD